MFNIQGKDGGYTSIGHMTLSVDKNPFSIISGETTLKFHDVRFETISKNLYYPQEKKLLWFFTMPSLTTLSGHNATSHAKNDFWGYLSWLMFVNNPTLLEKARSEETIKFFIMLLEKSYAGFQNLITRADVREQELQGFVETHIIIINPDKTPKKENRTIGPYMTDFTLSYEDDTKTLVELQLNSDPLFKNGKPTEGLKEAMNQQKDWFDWLKSNESSSLPKTNGLIIIGRKSEYLVNKSDIDSAILLIGYNVKLLTYDDLGENIKKIIERLNQRLTTAK